jgi:hypothetical protein
MQEPPPLTNLDAIKELSHPSEDSKAKQERDKYFGEHKRKERVKNVMNWVFIVFIIIVSVIATGIICIRLIHLALPAHIQWLTVEQQQGIDKLFFSGAIGGLLVSYFKKSNEG